MSQDDICQTGDHPSGGYVFLIQYSEYFFPTRDILIGEPEHALMHVGWGCWIYLETAQHVGMIAPLPTA